MNSTLATQLEASLRAQADRDVESMMASTRNGIVAITFESGCMDEGTQRWLDVVKAKLTEQRFQKLQTQLIEQLVLLSEKSQES